MQYKGIPLWKTAPFLRILIPLISGIVFQFYMSLSFQILLVFIIFLLILYFGVNYLSVDRKYKLRNIHGAILQCLVFFIACLLTYNADVRNSENWYGHKLRDSSFIIVKINEPLIKKAATSKAEATVEFVVNENSEPANGEIIIYFAKDEKLDLKYGQRLIINKKLVEIKSSGNPGAFNYKRYAGFKGLYHTVYLAPGEYSLLDMQPLYFRELLFSTRKFVLEILATHFKEDKVRGIAEALLIGYKENLDKDLLQAYSNTGVVHIIAISGLHLGLIYVVLIWFCNRFKFFKKYKLFEVLFILTGLWLFSFLTGGSASVLRSALMFSCILIGKAYFKKSSTYNTMAASAFLLLCYSPFYLWDVGFMLSYLAVFGIVWIQHPLYHSVYIKNKHLREVWKMVSVTVAAQIMAFPLCIYFFHQFPNLFIITNVVAVPLATIILFSGLFLIAFSWFPFIEYAGKLTGFLLKFMNSYIEWCNSFSFSVTDSIFANVLSTWLMYGVVICVCGGLILSNKKFLQVAVMFSFLFIINNAWENFRTVKQESIVIYNVPGKKAIDFISGNKYFFIGDTLLQKEGMLRNFHLKPARISAMTTESKTVFNNLKMNDGFINFNGKKLFLIDGKFKLDSQKIPIKTDVVLISKNSKMKIKDIISSIAPQVIVLDGTNSLWTI
ncbi:MAG: ComEC/Rec2 family competence protein, partial [Ferruginibacter sp.]